MDWLMALGAVCAVALLWLTVATLDAKDSAIRALRRAQERRP